MFKKGEYVGEFLDNPSLGGRVMAEGVDFKQFNTWAAFVEALARRSYCRGSVPIVSIDQIKQFWGLAGAPPQVRLSSSTR